MIGCVLGGNIRVVVDVTTIAVVRVGPPQLLQLQLASSPHD